MSNQKKGWTKTTFYGLKASTKEENLHKSIYE